MFLGVLDDEQKRAFLVLAHRMIAADGVVVPEERRALAALKAELGGVEAGADERDESELAEVFDSRRARMVVLLELLGLAHSDREFSLDERSLVTALAHEMGVEALELERLDHWVRDHMRLVASAMALIEG